MVGDVDGYSLTKIHLSQKIIVWNGAIIKWRCREWKKLIKYRIAEINFEPKTEFKVIDSSYNFRYAKLKKINENKEKN